LHIKRIILISIQSTCWLCSLHTINAINFNELLHKIYKYYVCK